jgi:hypothetical protein
MKHKVCHVLSVLLVVVRKLIAPFVKPVIPTTILERVVLALDASDVDITLVLSVSSSASLIHTPLSTPAKVSSGCTACSSLDGPTEIVESVGAAIEAAAVRRCL